MPTAAILINGFPGVGKSCVAAELAKHLSNVKIIDASLLDQVAAAAHESSTRANAELRKRLRDDVLRSLAPPLTPGGVGEDRGKILLITDTLYTSAPTSAFHQSYLTSCRSNGILLVHIVLSCDSATNILRLNRSLSKDGEKKAAIDEEGLVALTMEEEIGQFLSLQDKTRGHTMEGLCGELELDTTHLGAQETAGIVAVYCMDALRKQGWYFPPVRKMRQ